MQRVPWLVALLLLVGCDSSEPSPSPPPAAVAPAPAPASAVTPAPAAVPAIADATRGAATYQSLCASCHGPHGAGDGPAGASLNPRPAHHNDGAYMNGLSNEHLFRVIKEGGAALGKSPLMAPWGGALSDAQIRDVIAYVRSLADPPYSGPQP